MTTLHIDQLIQRTGRSLWWSRITTATLTMASVVFTAVLLAVLLDAEFGFNLYGLLALDALLIVVAAIAAWPVIQRARHNKSRHRGVALTIEDRLGIPDNQLINAVDLSTQTTPTVSGTLRDAAIDRGEQVARGVVPRDVIDKAPLFRAVQIVGVIGVCFILFYVVNPSVFRAVVPRLIAPFADLPPYTSLRFDVQIKPEQVYVGKPADVRVTLSGPDLPGRAYVVFVEDGQKLPGLPMYRNTSPVQGASTAPPENNAPEFYTMRVDRVDQDRQFYIDTPRGRSRLYTLPTDRAPLIEHARVTLRNPDYTGWPDMTRPLSSRPLCGLAGTEVLIHVTSNVPLSGGELRLTDPENPDTSAVQTEPLVPDSIDAHAGHVGFTLQKTGTYELTLTGSDDSPGAETAAGDIKVVPDRLPKIDVVLPDRQIMVPEGWPIDVAVGVGDDIGVSRAEIHVGVNDQPTQNIPLDLSYTNANQTAGHTDHKLAPRGLGASAGDVIKYYAAVWDNHPGSPQMAETPIHFAHIITMQQYMDLARSQYRVEDLQREFESIQDQLTELAAQREALLEAIEAIQAQAGEPGTMTDQQREAVEALQRELQDYADRSGELADALAERAEQASLYEFEEPYKQMLDQLSEQLQTQSNRSDALAEAMQTMCAADNAAACAAASQAAEQFALADKPFDQAAAQQAQTTERDLERLTLAEAMIREGERIRRVAFEQAELAVRMSGLSGQTVLTEAQQQRAESLAQEQETLREDLADAAGALSIAATKAAQALPNMSAGAMAVVDQIDGLKITTTQGAAEKAARAGSGGLAHQAALKAAEDLDSLLSDSGPAMAGSGDLDGCFSLPREQMQKAMNQMMAGMGAGVPSMGTQGGQGAGMSGSVAKMAMMGPNVPGAPGESDAEGVRGNRRQTGNGHGIPGYTTEETGEGAEIIHAESATRFGDGVTVQPGVPVQYREQAEAYFKRIAEESR